MGIEIQRNMAPPEWWGGFYLERCEEILIRGDGARCRRRAVFEGHYCALHTRKRAEAGGENAGHSCTVPDCTERVTHGNTTPTGTIWYCQPHAADEIARNARNG